MDPTELVKGLLQSGAAGAVIVVVWLFLKQNDKHSDLIKGLTDTTRELVINVTKQFTDAIDRHRTESQGQITALSERCHESHTATQSQVNGLFRDHIESNSKMTEAIRGLQTAVTELQKRP